MTEPVRTDMAASFQRLSDHDPAVDRIRVSAYYGDTGRVQNIDVSLNDKLVTLSDLSAVIEWLAKAGRPAPITSYLGDLPTAMSVNTSNGFR